MNVAVTIEGRPSQTIRARQLSAAFDVPPRDHEQLTWHGDLPIEDRPWNIGLIVGPSGSGKTTILREAFGEPVAMTWTGDAVADDFPAGMSIEEITAVCAAVGFNTIPAWLRPFHVLSTGEQFRVALARAMVECREDDTIVVDEFTSVVDRQVAQIGAHAAQKWIRKHNHTLVAATCHYDVVDWLQPDWVLEPASMAFQWRCLQRRPEVLCTVARVPYAYWRLFAPFHYLTRELNKAAQCYVLFAGADQQPAAFCGILHRPHPSTKRPVKGVSRLVTLPDWQGLGLAFALVDRVASMYHAAGYDVHTYPAHPALIRSFDRSPVWHLRDKPGLTTFKISKTKSTIAPSWRFGTRPCATFRYHGAPASLADVDLMLNANETKSTHAGGKTYA